MGEYKHFLEVTKSFPGVDVGTIFYTISIDKIIDAFPYISTEYDVVYIGADNNVEHVLFTKEQLDKDGHIDQYFKTI